MAKEDLMKKDCFAFKDNIDDNKNHHYGCSALDKLFCRESECAFYKNRREVDMTQVERDIRNYALPGSNS